MVAVVRVLRTSFVAVPALSRVEPASTSGPGAGAMTTSARASRVGGGLQATSTVRAPRRRAVASAARTNGVTPLAETPTTTSPGRTRVPTARAAARAVPLLGGEPLVANSRRRHARMLLLSGGMPTVRSGLEVLVHERQGLLHGRRVALLAHQASIDSRYAHAAPLLSDLRRARLVRLLAPEHGLWGAAQDHARVGATRDPATGLPVWSLYGARRAPTRTMLGGVDVLVVDLQDVGARYYTFVWTMALTMRVCARAGVAVVVLDRPNPLGGAIVEGNVPDPAFASFVGLYPLPPRHGLTIGELAAYLNERHALGCDLTVVSMKGWRRAMLWESTGLPWVAPSPNMPTPDTARVYPGGCLVEGTNLSEGRGTTRHPPGYTRAVSGVGML